MTLFFLFAAVSMNAANSDRNPYQIIVTRNPFDLRPPPVVQKVEAAPSEIVLTGISAAFDKKFALFKTEGKNFMLAEGQRDDQLQIELLAVDMNTCNATIKNHGIVQVIALTKPLSVLALAVEAAKERAAASRARRAERPMNQPDNLPSENRNNFSNNPAALRGAAANNSQGSDSSNNSNPSENNPTSDDSSFDGSSDNGSPQLYQYWRKGAEEIEQARIATADRVRNGTWQPYPRTPLTPPGTPSELIGADSVFMEHGPGVVISNGSP